MMGLHNTCVPNIEGVIAKTHDIRMKCAFVTILLLSMSTVGLSQSFREMFIDTTDNALDASKWLSTVTGFVPLLMPITEPAVGYGLGVGGVFFHPNEYRAAVKEGKLNSRVGELISPTPPSISGLGGFYTDNGSWAAGLGHLSIFKRDRIRYKVGLGGGSINLDYYGKGIFEERSRRFNTRTLGITNEVVFRLFDTDWWAGVGYSFAILKIDFEKRFEWIGEDLTHKETRNGALLPSIAYDNRDNIFTPNKGIRWYLQYGYHDKWLGGTETYHSLNTYIFGYLPLAPGHVSAIRIDSRSVFGDPTFIYRPFLVMRGLPVMKYQDNNATLVELEQRSAVYKRWSLVLFGGLGKTYSSINDFLEEDLVYSYGTGFRYLLARKFGMHMGLDFAWGPEDFAFYVTLGSGWFRL
jgi:hypothetical protein